MIVVKKKGGASCRTCIRAEHRPKKKGNQAKKGKCSVEIRLSLGMKETGSRGGGGGDEILLSLDARSKDLEGNKEEGSGRVKKKKRTTN